MPRRCPGGRMRPDWPQESMSLGKKIITLFLGLGACLAIGSYVALQLTIYPAFEAVERRSATQDLERVMRMLDSDLRGLEIMNMEYSIWDQTHDYARGFRPEYVEENIDPAYWHSLDLHMMLFFDAEGMPLSGVLTNPVNGEMLDLEAELPTPLRHGHPLVTHASISSSVKGLLQTRSGILQVVSYPILKSEGLGPIAGSMITGQFLNADRIAKLSERAAADLALYPLVAGTLPASRTEIGRRLRVSGTSTFQETDDASIRSFQLLRNLIGDPIAVLEVVSPRDVTRLGANTIRTALWLIACAGALFLLAALLFLRHLIINPVQALTDRILGIQDTADLEVDIDNHPSDEIGILAREFGAFARRLGRTQRELESARDEAVELSKAKSEFLARMSHEIRTPMNGVLGMTELLRNTVLNFRQQRFVKGIYESAETLLTIINDILDFSKMEAGKLRLESVDLDLRSIVEETLDTLADEAHRKGLELVAVLPPGMPTAVRSDPIRLRQVLMNLVGNAVKFTDIGEVAVRLDAAPVDGGLLDVSIDIVDTGIGISAEKQQAIFDAFTQEDGSTTRLYGGTGLGLAISKQIIELMGGELRLRSTPGSGSTFSVSLRLEAAEEPAPRETKQTEGIAGKRVLIVDDNSTNREILELHLSSWRAETASTPGAQDAMKILVAAAEAGRHYDVAILDMHMPETDGLGLARQIRANADLRDLKLLILSSVATPASDKTLRELRIAGQLTKPVRQSELYDAIISIIGDGTVALPHLGAKRRAVRLLRGSVLLAEDNAVNQTVAVGMLETLGVSATVAANGREAVAVAQAGNFDAILMDCQMPDLDGFAATAAIRGHEAGMGRSPTPIIAVTANALKGDREKCLAAGMDHYLSKPYTIEQLHAVLATHLQFAGGAIPERTEVALPADEQSPIDRRVLDTLVELQNCGDPGLLSKVINVYLDNSRELNSNLRTAVAAANDDGIREIAHALKSSSANVGAMGLADLCKRLETMARENRLDDARAVQEQVEREYALVVEALRDELEAAA